jgi:hypothetical protein
VTHQPEVGGQGSPADLNFPFADNLAQHPVVERQAQPALRYHERGSARRALAPMTIAS